MPEFALIRSGQFSEIRNLPERPPHIGHKGVQWFPVVRTFGTPGEAIEGDAWVIRAVDPATLPEPVPRSISPRQARLAIMAAGLLDAANAAVSQADDATKIAWEFSIEIRRDDPGVIGLAKGIGLNDGQIDELFKAAGKL